MNYDVTAPVYDSYAAELLVPRAGYCRRCFVIRLSVLDTIGICLFCTELELSAPTLLTPGRSHPYTRRVVCSTCGGWPVVYRAKWRPCNRTDVNRC